MHPDNDRRAAGLLALVCTAQFVDVLGVTVLIVALPTIQHQLRLTSADLSWIAASYALLFGGFLLPAGRAADLVGRQLLFGLGSALVAAGALVCAVAGGAAAMLAGRALQGLGAALSVPAALAVLLSTFPAGKRRERALGIWTMAGAAGGASGFAVGGLVTQLVGWRWLFAAIVPWGIAAVIAALGLLDADPPTPLGQRRSDAGSADRCGIDVPGALLSITAVVLLILGFTRAQDRGFANPSAWLPLALAPGAAAAFVAAERRSRAPLVPPRLWSVSQFRLGAGMAGILTATTSGTGVVGTLFVQHVLGVSAGASGAAFLMFSAGVVAGSTVAPAVIVRRGPVLAMTSGLAIIALGMTTQAVGVWQRSLPTFLIGLSLSGLGLGIASVGSTAYGTAATTDVTAGIVGGLLNAAAQIGTAVGIAALLVVANSSRSGPVAAYLLAAGLAAAAMLVTGAHHRMGGRPARLRWTG